MRNETTKHYSSWRDYNPNDHQFSKRWPNFTPQEVACRDGSFKLHPPSMDKLQALREELGRPLIVNSAYRSPKYNKRVGGVKNSQHLRGTAFDIAMVNQDTEAFLRAAEKVGFVGIGFYPRQDFIHVDNRPGSRARWGKFWKAKPARNWKVEEKTPIPAKPTKRPENTHVVVDAPAPKPKPKTPTIAQRIAGWFS